MKKKPAPIAPSAMPSRTTPERDAEDVRRLDEHRIEERRGGEEDEEGQEERQRADDVAGQALLRGQGANLALDPDPLANGERDRVEDLGEVATDLVLDRDGRGHQLEVLRLHALDHVLEREVERQAEVDLADDAAELDRDRRPRLANDELDGLQERRAGAERVGDQRDRVRQLLVERAEARRLAIVQPEPRDHEPDEEAQHQDDRVLERR